MCDMWYKKVMKINDKLYWNVYCFFCQEVKWEIKFVEKEYVCFEILKLNGNFNLIWKIFNCCFLKKNVLLVVVENLFFLVNKFNEFYVNVGKVIVLKVMNFVKEYNFNI